MTTSLHPSHPFPLGTRCSRCHRYLVRGSRAKRSLGGKWRHDSCQHLAEPAEAEFVELAEALMHLHPWPRLLALQSQLSDAELQLAALDDRPPVIPEQRASGPDRAELLRERVDQLRAAIDGERRWKAGRLAAEWADGH